MSGYGRLKKPTHNPFLEACNKDTTKYPGWNHNMYVQAARVARRMEEDNMAMITDDELFVYKYKDTHLAEADMMAELTNDEVRAIAQGFVFHHTRLTDSLIKTTHEWNAGAQLEKCRRIAQKVD
jgi:hypothetical protein